jgi:hypothetical protein
MLHVLSSKPFPRTTPVFSRAHILGIGPLLLVPRLPAPPYSGRRTNAGSTSAALRDGR